MPNNVKTNNLIAGECDIPDELSSFVTTLVCGSDPRAVKSSECSRRVKSLSQDLIYAVTHGKIKTAKHITLGMTLKSITSSRKVVDVINKYGHCCSYNTIEELETEATFASSSRSNICPEGVQLSPGLCTGVAFDNFDRFVETNTGKDTLHDTVGILYQNIDLNDDNSSLCENVDNDTAESPVPKRRRTFDAIAPELPAYYTKPKVIAKLLPFDDELRQINPSNYDLIKKSRCSVSFVALFPSAANAYVGRLQ